MSLPTRCRDKSKAFDQFAVFVASCIEKFFLDSITKILSVIIESVVEQNDFSYWHIGLIFSWHVIFKNAATPIPTYLLKVGSRNSMVGWIRSWAVLAGIFVGLGYIGLSFALSQGLMVMLLMATISGVGHSCLKLFDMMSLKNSFPNGFGKTYALSNFASSAGMATLPVILEYLQRHYGTQGAVFIFGAILWHTVIIGFLLKPSSLNDGKSTIEHNDVTIKNESGESKIRSSFNPAPGVLDLLESHPSFVFFILVGILDHVNVIAWTMYLVPFCESSGIPSYVAVTLSTVGGISGGIGKLIAYFVSRYQGAQRTLLVATSVLVACSYVAMITLQTFLVFWISSAISGFSMGLSTTIIISTLDHTVCKFHFKIALPLLLSLRTFSTLVGAVVSGLIRDISGNFRCTFGFLTVVCLVKGASAVFLCRSNEHRRECNNCESELTQYREEDTSHQSNRNIFQDHD